MFVVEKSENAKIGLAAATYLPIFATCSSTCPLLNNGCYAQGGNVGMNVRRLEREMSGLGGDVIAILEAGEIRDAAERVKDSRPLRLHVSGDAITEFRARMLADAARSWKGRVWSYTHAWRDVSRESWGGVSILASCERLEDAKKAMKAGYAAALVTGPHPANGRAYERDGVKIIPCPAQTRKDVKCTTCRLCFDDQALLARNAVIAFETHGAGKKRALTVLQ